MNPHCSAPTHGFPCFSDPSPQILWSEYLCPHPHPHSYCELLLFFMYSKQLHPVLKAPGELVLLDFKIQEAPYNRPSSMVTWPPGEDTHTQNTVPVRSVVRNQESVYSNSVQGWGAWQQNAKENTSHVEPSTFWMPGRIQPSESQKLETVPLTPGAKPTATTRGGQSQTKPSQLVDTPQEVNHTLLNWNHSRF